MPRVLCVVVFGVLLLLPAAFTARHVLQLIAMAYVAVDADEVSIQFSEASYDPNTITIISG